MCEIENKKMHNPHNISLDNISLDYQTDSNGIKIRNGMFGSFLAGMLTGRQIEWAVQQGDITITRIDDDGNEYNSFDAKHLNPNSYDLAIGNKIGYYEINDTDIIDIKNRDSFKFITEDIPEEGYVIRPNTLYLISTRDIIGSNKYIPQITGRSSIGRLGICTNQVAGFGDIGFKGSFTCQLSTIYPVRIYPYFPMIQIYFETPYGHIDSLYDGKYNNNNGCIKPSAIYDDFKNPKYVDIT